MKTIGVVTTNRSDYGIYRPVLRKMKADPDIKLLLYVSGAHLSKKHGHTVKEIEADGFTIADRIELDISNDSQAGLANTLGQAVQGFSAALQRQRSDLLVILGDRYEMFAAAAAATPLLIPLVHIHGGEITEGAIDNSFRHAMTKMAHFHFVSNDLHKLRVQQMGEEPWRVVVSGAPGLDNLAEVDYLSPEELAKRFNLSAKEPPLLATFHPETMDADHIGLHATEFLVALKMTGRPVVFTAPSNDTHGSQIREQIGRFLEDNPSSRMVENFGVQGYFSMMKWAAAMVGNSSSGIIEAPSFGLPVVNIGDRQKGRLRAGNVIESKNDRASIQEAIKKALDPAFRAGLQSKQNPYGDGKAAVRIVEALKRLVIDERLLMKKFVDA